METKTSDILKWEQTRDPLALLVTWVTVELLLQCIFTCIIIAVGTKMKSAGICDENGRLITNSTEQQEKWKKHFCEVLNREIPDFLSYVWETDEIFEINCEEQSILEIRNALK